MPILNAYSDYENYLLLADDVHAAGGQYVLTGLDNIVYALANYQHWQVLTQSLLYAANTYSATIVTSAFSIRLTRPLVLMTSETVNTFAMGIFSDDVRFPFYENISDAFIKPEDGLENRDSAGNDPERVENNGNCNG